MSTVGVKLIALISEPSKDNKRIEQLTALLLKQAALNKELYEWWTHGEQYRDIGLKQYMRAL